MNKNFYVAIVILFTVLMVNSVQVNAIAPTEDYGEAFTVNFADALLNPVVTIGVNRGSGGTYVSQKYPLGLYLNFNNINKLAYYESAAQLESYTGQTIYVINSSSGSLGQSSRINLTYNGVLYADGWFRWLRVDSTKVKWVISIDSWNEANIPTSGSGFLRINYYNTGIFDSLYLNADPTNNRCGDAINKCSTTGITTQNLFDGMLTTYYDTATNNHVFLNAQATTTISGTKVMKWNYTYNILNQYESWLNVTRNSTLSNVTIKYLDQSFNFGDNTTNNLSVYNGNRSNGGIFNLSKQIYAFSKNLEDVEGIGTTQTTGNISFNKSFYNLGDQINITYNLTNADFVNKKYRLKTYDTYGFYSNEPITNSTYYINHIAHDKTVSTIFTSYLWEYDVNNVGIVLDNETVNYGIALINLTGNITTDKIAYNTTETAVISFNTSINGRLKIRSPFAQFWFYDVSAGNNQSFNWYIAGSDEIGLWEVALQYYDGVWNTMATAYFTVNALSDRVNFSQTNYNTGDTLTIVSWGYENGYILLLDSVGTIKLNYTYTGGQVNIKTYYLTATSSTGVWTTRLFNATGVETAVDTTLITTGVVTVTPTVTVPVTVTPTPQVTCTGDNLLDAAGCISTAILGKTDTDNDGDISSVEIGKRGNKIFDVLLLFVFVILLMMMFTKRK